MGAIPGKRTIDNVFKNDETNKKNIKGRDADLVNKRNWKIVYRVYYYTAFCKFIYDHMIKNLSEDFDIAEFTIGKIISGNSDKISEVKKQEPTIQQLKKMYPKYNWDLHK